MKINSMKHLQLITILALGSLAASAAVPLRWTVETSRATPATFEAYQGETLALEASLQSYGKPLEAPLNYSLYWQTNGMGSTYWSVPCPSSATTTNVLFAIWSPTNDVGAKVYNCFIGQPGTIYHAAFQLRLRPSPGATPNELPLPQKVIDFAKVTVLNPPWSGGGGGGGVDTNAVREIAREEIAPATNIIESQIAALQSGKLDKTDVVPASTNAADGTAAEAKTARNIFDEKAYNKTYTDNWTITPSHEGYYVSEAHFTPSDANEVWSYELRDAEDNYISGFDSEIVRLEVVHFPNGTIATREIGVSEDTAHSLAKRAANPASGAIAKFDADKNLIAATPSSHNTPGDFRAPTDNECHETEFTEWTPVDLPSGESVIGQPRYESDKFVWDDGDIERGLAWFSDYCDDDETRVVFHKEMSTLSFTATRSAVCTDGETFVTHSFVTNAAQSAASAAVSTNNPALVQTIRTSTAGVYRNFGDEYVYQPTAFTPFTWSGSRSDAVAAIGNTQPVVDYQYENYIELVADFELNGHFYWGYAYDVITSPAFHFDFWASYYDEQRGEWVDDYIELIASRTATEYSRSNPTDTFAHQNEMSSINTSVTQLRNRLDGETKVLRTGNPGELGTGWGYLQTSLDGDYRNWRIRVPRWTNVTGTATNNAQAVQTYVSWTNGNQRSIGYNLFTVNPLSWTQNWDFERKVSETRGAYGSDAVQFADYNIGFLLKGSIGVSGASSHYLEYTLEHTQGLSFTSRINLDGWTLTNRIYYVGSGSSAAWVTQQGYYRPIRMEVIREWTYSTGSGYTNDARAEIVISGLFVNATDVERTSSGSFTLNYNVICESEHVRLVRNYTDGTSSVLVDTTIVDSFHGCSVSASVPSAAQFENAYGTYYKLIGTLDSGVFYDPGLDCSFRISVTNGCFYSEKYCDGDWRK